MSNTTPSPTLSGSTWPRSEPPMPVPNTSMLPGADDAPPAAVDLMSRVVQGAHDTIDRLADSAVPAVRQFGESLSGAEQALHAKAEQAHEAGDAGSDSLRSTVRENPLVAVAAALVVGVVLARITR